MFVPAEALEELPGFLMTLLNNGLILGVLACIFIEQEFFFKALEVRFMESGLNDFF